MAQRSKKKALTTRNAKKHSAGVSAGAAAEAAEVPIIEVPADGTLEVVVEVGPIVMPYTVAYAGRTVIKSLVDRAELITVTAGDFVLGWAFAHAAKGWSHSIGYSIDGGPVRILEQRSEANKDADHSVSFALVRSRRPGQ